jgi:predicted MPP superfamily phosphohydrolase
VGKTAVSRRKFLRTSLAAATSAAIPLAAYAQWVEPHHLTVERLELKIPNLPEAFDGFRIAQLSDFHYGTYTGEHEISAAVRLANSLKPDLVVITGDFITAPSFDRTPATTHPVYTELGLCAQVLSGLSSANAVLGCVGNHDVWVNRQYIAEVFSSFAMTLLVNENRAIERNGKRLWIAGVDDAIFGTADFARALRGIPPNEPILMLAHEPDLADEAAKYPIAVQLAGHSHGGQIRFPLLGALYLPELAKKYPFGYYRVGKMHLYTNRGIGTIVLPYRFNAPPEVTIVTLRTGLG